MKNKWVIFGIPIVAIIIFVGVYFVNKGSQNDAQDDIREYTPEIVKDETIEEQYDVIVLGGEPEGVAAAVSAARNGAKTLLVEHRDNLGGLMTFGMLNFIDMVQGPDGKSAVKGIFEEWHKMVGGDNAFNIELAKSAFLKLVVDEPNITLALNTEIMDAIIAEDGKTVIGVELNNDQQGKFSAYANYFIDATQDADFAVMAGAPYYVGGEDINLKDRLMAVTPMIHLQDVDWDGVRRAVKEKTFGEAEITETVAWGFNELHYDYEPVEENTRLRGLNLVRIKNENGDDDFYINALQIFGVNGLKDDEIAAALEKGKRETENVVKFLQQHFPGFENAKIASFPTELYVRETRHIKSEYMLPMSDVWTNRNHWDGIGMGGYPVDVQATSVNDYGYVLSSPKQYAIPFRSLVPLEVEGLIVVSRSAGYSSLAAGSARVIPTGMASGEAGGLAAALCLENDITFRELSKNEELIKELRTRLAKQGANVEEFELDYPYQGEWFDEAIQYLMNYGLVVGGYTNDLGVDNALVPMHFANILLNGLNRIYGDETNEQYDQLKNVVVESNFENEEQFTRNEVAAFILSAFANENVTGNDAWERAHELGLVDDELYNRINEDRPLVRKEGYYLATHLLKNINQ